VAQALDRQQDLPVDAKDITVVEQSLSHHPDTHPYLRKGFAYPKDWEFVAPMPSTNVSKTEDIDEQETDPSVKLAIKSWKRHNPTGTLKEERRKLARGEIADLPWMDAKYSSSGFGTQWPSSPERGDLFVKTDRMPSQLYKFNGNEWIVIDKNSTDNYTYDTAYIDHLIEKIATGEYDPDLLSDAERTQVAQQLLNQPNTNA
jgi:hypothetical protein